MPAYWRVHAYTSQPNRNNSQATWQNESTWPHSAYTNACVCIHTKCTKWSQLQACCTASSCLLAAALIMCAMWSGLTTPGSYTRNMHIYPETTCLRFLSPGALWFLGTETSIYLQEYHVRRCFRVPGAWWFVHSAIAHVRVDISCYLSSI